jgi:hypothetical protein
MEQMMERRIDCERCRESEEWNERGESGKALMVKKEWQRR